jgi:molybdopterin synthase catalytic subunit
MSSQSTSELKMIRVSDEAINAMTALNALQSTGATSGHGAEILFLGVVRDINLGRKVTAVAYDAFPPLAEKTLAAIADEARAQWGDLQIAIFHRTGKLTVGEVSLAIGVSSRHRDESYLASRWIIEEIKERAPVWKKEFYSDGESEWLKGHALCQHKPAAAAPVR